MVLRPEAREPATALEASAPMRDNYPIVVFWWDPDQEWVADIPDLRGCSASGATPDEAIREVMLGRDLWLEVAAERGTPLPHPLETRFLPSVVLERRRAEAST